MSAKIGIPSIVSATCVGTLIGSISAGLRVTPQHVWNGMSAQASASPRQCGVLFRRLRVFSLSKLDPGILTGPIDCFPKMLS